MDFDFGEAPEGVVEEATESATARINAISEGAGEKIEALHRRLEGTGPEGLGAANREVVRLLLEIEAEYEGAIGEWEAELARAVSLMRGRVRESLWGGYLGGEGEE